MSWLDALTLETVIVNTTYGEVYKGVKSAVQDDCIVLRDAQLVREDGKLSHPIDGPYAIPREKVGGINMVVHVAPENA